MFVLNNYYSDYKLWKKTEEYNKIIERVIVILFSNFIQNMLFIIIFYQVFKNKKII